MPAPARPPRPTARERLRYARALLPRFRLQRRAVLILLLAPVLYAGLQAWHRVADAFGNYPVRVVRALDAPQPPAVESADFRAAVAAFTETTMLRGHEIELLVDGPITLARLDADIRAATRSVEIQNYYCERGVVTDWLRDLLTAKAREGVKVFFLRDGFGCEALTRGYLDTLRTAGVEVATLRPLRWWAVHESMHRSHVRSVTIDGRIGYAGGFGFADKWLRGKDAPAWRETSVRFTGPAVAQMAAAFAIGWADATGELLAGNGIFPDADLVHDGPGYAGVMYTKRAYGTPVAERYLALALSGARRRVHIANSYFVPNRELRSWLVAAAKRGVDVRVLVPSEKIDVRFTYWAGRSTYGELLDAGVRIYEYLPTMMHAKSMVIDDAFVSVGSMNLDNLSLRINDEAVLLAVDRRLAGALSAQYERDLRQSREVTRELLARRSPYERVMTGLAWLLRDLL